MKTLFFIFSIISIFFILSVQQNPRNLNVTSSNNFLQSRIFPHKVLSTLKNTVFGKHLLDLVSEKFHNGDGIDSLVQAFDELKGQLQDFQHSEEYSYKKVHKIYENALKKQKEIVDQSIANINFFQSKLENNQIKLGEKQNLINQLEFERETIRRNIKILSDIRANEKVESEMRIKNSETLINGIQRTLSFFRQRTIGDEDLDLDAILQITGLMGNIETSLQQTLPDEINSEKLAKNNYKSFIKAQNARLSNINKEIDTLMTDAKESEKKTLMVQNDIIEENNMRESAEQMKSDIENLLRNLENAYDQTKALRTEQFNQLKSLRARIVEHSDNHQKSMHKSSSM